MLMDPKEFALQLRALRDGGVGFVLDDLLDCMARGSMQPETVLAIASARKAGGAVVHRDTSGD